MIALHDSGAEGGDNEGNFHVEQRHRGDAANLF